VPDAIDAITLEVVRNRLQHVTQEMSAAIVKTAVSPVMSEARDFSCVVYDTAGRIVASAATVPFHFGVSADAIAVVRARFERIAPGDVFLANDPHDGGGLHLQDVVVMRPIFRGRTRVGWASASGHMIDMGGLVPGSFAPNARECYQEGVRIPPVRIVRGGEPADDLWRLVLNNVRQPEIVEMDLKSLVAGTHVAAEKVLALEAEYGPRALRAAFAAIRRLSARVVRTRLAEIPRGTYVEQGWTEFDDDAFRVRCALRVDGGGLAFDLTGSDPQCPRFFNSKPHIVRSELAVRVHQILAHDVPFTDAILDAVRVVAPEGSIVNARPPAPVAAAHMHVALLAMELGETCLKKALACALPSGAVVARQRRITAPGGTTGMGLSSWHGGGETFLVMDGNAVGAGACAERDGIDMTGSDYGGPGLVYPDVETIEQAYPVLYRWKRLRADAGGAGRFRGGASIDAAFTPYGVERLDGTTLGMRRAVPLSGLFGGYPGACTLFEVGTSGARTVLGLNASGIALGAGETFRFAVASGSGLGDPLERDPARVAADVRDGYVSRDVARRVYGVALDAAGDPDTAATDEARAALRGARRARAAFPAPPAAGVPRDAAPVARLSARIDVVRARGTLVARCAACGTGLARAPEPWKTGAGVAETIVGSPEYTERTGAWAPLRDAGPVVLREWICPGCARVLDTEVALASAAREDDVRPAFWTGTP
jgi:N-methylhydantoinase B